MTTRTADQIARSIANWNADDDTYSPIRNNAERDLIVAALSPPERLPIFAEGGLGSRLLRAAEAYAKDEYVFSPDEGSDHELTEFERILFEDMINGLFSHEPFASILREAASAARAMPLHKGTE